MLHLYRFGWQRETVPAQVNSVIQPRDLRLAPDQSTRPCGIDRKSADCCPAVHPECVAFAWPWHRRCCWIGCAKCPTAVRWWDAYNSVMPLCCTNWLSSVRYSCAVSADSSNNNNIHFAEIVSPYILRHMPNSVNKKSQSKTHTHTHTNTYRKTVNWIDHLECSIVQMVAGQIERTQMCHRLQQTHRHRAHVGHWQRAQTRQQLNVLFGMCAKMESDRQLTVTEVRHTQTQSVWHTATATRHAHNRKVEWRHQMGVDGVGVLEWICTQVDVSEMKAEFINFNHRNMHARITSMSLFSVQTLISQ